MRVEPGTSFEIMVQRLCCCGRERKLCSHVCHFEGSAGLNQIESNNKCLAILTRSVLVVVGANFSCHRERSRLTE